ncbi:hypothetical protein chiPu_0003886 [Chiloscyllium punctatum]|uniref:Uncharacterized protein n=1 Tax=Chiloscyllium punctatum TaxID=137246 RepID=A0A401S506_CHIPU|nr:hypothetical protein [Chiloscyllium punctatum]
MGANNGKQCGSEGKGSSSISSDMSSSTDHTPTKARGNAATSEGSASLPVCVSVFTNSEMQVFGLEQCEVCEREIREYLP